MKNQFWKNEMAVMQNPFEALQTLMVHSSF